MDQYRWVPVDAYQIKNGRYEFNSDYQAPPQQQQDTGTGQEEKVPNSSQEEKEPQQQDGRTDQEEKVQDSPQPLDNLGRLVENTDANSSSITRSPRPDANNPRTSYSLRRDEENAQFTGEPRADRRQVQFTVGEENNDSSMEPGTGELLIQSINQSGTYQAPTTDEQNQQFVRAVTESLNGPTEQPTTSSRTSQIHNSAQGDQLMTNAGTSEAEADTLFQSTSQTPEGSGSPRHGLSNLDISNIRIRESSESPVLQESNNNWKCFSELPSGFENLLTSGNNNMSGFAHLLPNQKPDPKSLILDHEDPWVPQDDASKPEYRNKFVMGQAGDFYTPRLTTNNKFMWARYDGSIKPRAENIVELATTSGDNNKTTTTNDNGPPSWWWWWLKSPLRWTWDDDDDDDFKRHGTTTTETEYYYYYDDDDKNPLKKSKSGAEIGSKCNIYQEYNPATGRCRYKCGVHQERNPDTGRCRNKCEPHQTRNPLTGRCKAV